MVWRAPVDPLKRLLGATPAQTLTYYQLDLVRYDSLSGNCRVGHPEREDSRLSETSFGFWEGDKH